MAVPALTTRRALFAVPALLPALPVLAHTSPPPGKYDWPAFIKLLEWMHPNGRAAALSAFECGMRMEDLFIIMLTGSNAPWLSFRVNEPGRAIRNFDATGAC